MRAPSSIAFLTLCALLWSAQPGTAESPKVSRTVDSSGTPVISIRGESPAKTTASPEPVTVVSPKKDFKVYELDGPGAPAGAPSQAPQIVVIASPPPIPANPAAFNYGGYGFGFPGYGGFGFPGYGVGYRGYAGYSGVRPVAPVNYQNPPVNYQNPPVNYRPAVPQGMYRHR